MYTKYYRSWNREDLEELLPGMPSLNSLRHCSSDPRDGSHFQETPSPTTNSPLHL